MDVSTPQSREQRGSGLILSLSHLAASGRIWRSCALALRSRSYKMQSCDRGWHDQSVFLRPFSTELLVPDVLVVPLVRGSAVLPSG